MNQLREVKDFLGIDFGTTCSAMVNYRMVNKKKYDPFRFGDENRKPIPSIVAIDKTTGEIFTGREAWNKKNELNDTCEVFSSIKTIIDQNHGFYIADKYWTPIDIASEIFKALKREAGKSRVELREATVAIPVGFSARKRKSLRDAANKAGISIASFISEPTAAFFANYDALKSASTVAVFDWGGGTLDVSVLQNDNGRITELATGGEPVAGDAIDDRIARRIFARISRKKEIDLSYAEIDSKNKDRLLMQVENAKIKLSEVDEASIKFIFCGKYVDEVLDYDWFADIVAPEVKMAIDCLEKTIEQSGLNLANIDKILLVGGSSNLRPLLEVMAEKYDDKLYCPNMTEWNVGEGAAKLMATPGAYCSAQNISVVLSDIPEKRDGEWEWVANNYPMLEKGTELQNWKQSFYFGIVDTSKVARFVFTGSDDIDEMPDKYKTLEVDSYSFLQEKIVAEAAVDENGIFSVCAYSSMRPKDKAVVWEYDQLKTIYVLPKV